MKTCESRNPGCNDVAVVELLGLVARAAIIGVAAGFFLGGAALLLSSDSIPVLSDAAEMHAASLPRF
jgi:hypothetical protein